MARGLGRLRAAGLALAAIGAMLVATAPAHAANWLEMNFWLSGPRYDAKMPACDDSWVFGKIQRAFAQKESRFWHSPLQLVGFEQVRETGFMPWKSESIPRRFCSGKVMVSDGIRRPVHYWIGEDTGEIGASWGVEWCVVGLDRNWAYNPRCKMAQP